MKGLPPISCVRCGTPGEPLNPRRYLGCDRCRSEGVPSNFRWRLDDDAVREAVQSRGPVGIGLWRFGSAMPVPNPVSLGEGDTPLLPLTNLGETYGLQNLFAKNESVNPTWSHKDRLAAVTVAAAGASGAKVVTAASTGNHGAAVAAYAARAGLACVIATLTSVPETMKDLMVGYGASVVATETSEGRYELVARGIERHGWYAASNAAAPPVGSDAYGLAGYKTIAYELVESMGSAPDWLIVPVAYGDCLAGIAEGFSDLQRAGVIDRPPRLVGAELFGALARGIADDRLVEMPTNPTEAFSIGGPSATYQAIEALRDGSGMAHTVSEEELLTARTDLGVREGLYAEAAAAVPFAAAATLATEGAIAPDDRVVCLLTSTGLKDLRPSGHDADGVTTVSSSEIDEIVDELQKETESRIEEKL